MTFGLRTLGRPLMWRLLRVLNLGVLVLALHPNGALKSEGWPRSFRCGLAVDRLGRPIPWYSYPFIHFIEPRLRPSLRVFEYGCGHSTLWFAARVGNIVAVEHDRSWMRTIGGALSTNAVVIHRPEKEAYVSEVTKHGQFDIVVVDGLARVECAKMAVKVLTPSGVIVWDNSDRPEFLEGLAWLSALGFRELPFSGMHPSWHYLSRTSVLYRDGNCLRI